MWGGPTQFSPTSHRTSWCTAAVSVVGHRHCWYRHRSGPAAYLPGLISDCGLVWRTLGCLTLVSVTRLDPDSDLETCSWFDLRCASLPMNLHGDLASSCSQTIPDLLFSPCLCTVGQAPHLSAWLTHLALSQYSVWEQLSHALSWQTFTTVGILFWCLWAVPAPQDLLPLLLPFFHALIDGRNWNENWILIEIN